MQSSLWNVKCILATFTAECICVRAFTLTTLYCNHLTAEQAKAIWALCSCKVSCLPLRSLSPQIHFHWLPHLSVWKYIILMILHLCQRANTSNRCSFFFLQGKSTNQALIYNWICQNIFGGSVWLICSSTGHFTFHYGPAWSCSPRVTCGREELTAGLDVWFGIWLPL